MKTATPIGRVAGVPLAVHWSVVVVFGLLTWSLAEGILPASVDDASTSAYWIAAAIGGTLFLQSLLAHEVAHALVARRHGIGVRQMTLWLFGGVAELEREAQTPQAELRIAAAGPATSAACAAVFGLAAALATILDASLAAALLAWLAAANVVLALFNLIPGAPLDGGRILTAWLWRRHGDRLRAIRTATKVGRAAGYGLMGLGIVELVFGADMGGLWTVFLGWFLLGAARGEAAHAEASQALAGLRVGDVMTPAPERVPSWMSLQVFVHEYALRGRHSTFPVDDRDGRVVGLVTLAQVKSRPVSSWPDVTVAAVMTPLPGVPAVAPDDELASAIAGASESGGRLLVFDAGALVGIVTPSDLAWALELSLLRSGADNARDGRAPGRNRPRASAPPVANAIDAP